MHLWCESSGRIVHVFRVWQENRRLAEIKIVIAQLSDPVKMIHRVICSQVHDVI